MTHMKKGFFAVALLLASAVSAKTTTFGRSYFQGVSHHLPTFAGNLCCDSKHDAYADLSVVAGFSQSWNKEDLAKWMSFNNKTSMVIKGTADIATDIQAQNLLLGTLHVSTITLAPQVRTFQADFNARLCLNELMEGVFATAKLPVAHVRVNPNMVESGLTSSTNLVATTFVVGDASTSPYANAVEAFKGDKTMGTTNTSKMNYGKIDGLQKLTKVGNATLSLGYKLVDKENAHFSVAVSGLLNGAGASEAIYAFEPVIGTMGRHGFGGIIDGHVRLYEHNDYEFSAHMQGSVYTLFDAKVTRSYDFRTKHGVGSRYLMLKKYTAGHLIDVTGFTQAINLTTLDAKIGVDAMFNGDLVLRMKHGNLSVDLGYGVAGQTKEKFKSWVSNDPFTANYGAYATGVSDTHANRDDVVTQDVLITGFKTLGTTTAATAAAAAAGSYLKLTDLDTTSGMAPMALSHQISGNLSYVWADNKWMPTVGLGGSAEICGKDNNSLSQWGVHVNMGFSF